MPAWRNFSASDRLLERAGRVDALFRQANHMYGGHAIVGAHVPLAPGWPLLQIPQGRPGYALLFRRRRDQPGRLSMKRSISRAFQASGYFHLRKQLFRHGHVRETLDLAQADRRSREGYDMPGEVVDGMNFREVRDKLSEIIASIRKDPHPASSRRALIVIAATPCPTRPVIDEGRSWKNIG